MSHACHFIWTRNTRRQHRSEASYVACLPFHLDSKHPSHSPHCFSFCVSRKLVVMTVLARVRSFLPEMDVANKQLEEAMRERPREEFDIESVPEGSQHIEMVTTLWPSPLARCCTHPPASQRCPGASALVHAPPWKTQRDSALDCTSVRWFSCSVVASLLTLTFVRARICTPSPTTF